MTELPFPLSGRTLVTGPSNAGKTRTTVRALDRWTTDRGTDGIVALDFAPEIERDGVLLGGRLTRFTDVPEAVWYGSIEAHAPRATGETTAETLALATENARRSRAVIESAPTGPRAVFVNDATIPFQAGDELDAAALFEYCAGAEVVVCNAFEGGELGSDDPVSRNERTTLKRLRAWTDHLVEL
ncbi:hypothetical protein [Halobellus captivus]|uniref:hypothetical protein n=1 Tax=Halobellus captivus TaxID=2592614 RepID=UPI00119E84D0|nr:hypothetical protein [Halobellus captivus]